MGLGCKNRFMRVASLFVIALAVGCGGEPPLPDAYPASGRVLLDGKPIEGVSVTLLPQAGVPGRGGYGVTDANGAFSITSVEGQDGVQPGKYKVVFQKLAQPDGSPIPPGATAADVGAENILPPAYNSPEMCTTFADIQAGTNPDMEFDLDSKRKR
ncbi:carboxypeptidase-like regulatory domain-containing protein [Rosistilla oblonga]|uniref:carboxypeptidase-like regulatory domain-containing protein n=1 Tax=Rosistilla oblonga TaxID=2527990 RepID=UPI003A96B204